MPNPNAPTPIDNTYTFPAGFFSEDQSFDFQIDVTGKEKTIDLPDGGQIVTAPGQVATLTNVTDEKSVTLNITGTTHITTLDDGSTLYEVNGRNLVQDEAIIVDNSQPGLVLTIGHFSYIFDEDGNLTQPLQGQGQVINVFDLLV